jgi:alkylation response protein AidB-like acyl-CoA dehydrogenase
MSTYRAPLRDMQFVLRELAGLDEIAKLPGFEETPDVLDAILEEASTFATEVLDPINRSGDVEGCTWKDGAVTTPTGFKEAYGQFAKAGWIGLPVSAEHGGQGLPHVLLGPTLEMWNGANVGFANGPLLNQGAIEAIELCGSDEQKHTYIPKLVSCEWCGTMCLTEPQAGSDLAAVRTKAVPEGEHYKLFGQKIFITFGEHDMAPNIIHLVLARLPNAPEGTKGISLFIVPKMLVNADGSLGERNDVYCAGIEHKLGINGNPTCTLAAAVMKQMTKAAKALDESDDDVNAIKQQLTLWGVVAGGWQMARAAQISAAKIAAGTGDPFYAAKLATARFYADHVLNQAPALHYEIVHGSASVMTLTEEQFDLDRQLLVVA